MGLATAGLLMFPWEGIRADEITDQALIVVAQIGKIDAVKRLIDEGANIEATDQQGRTVLEVATAFGQADVVKILLMAGANVNAGAGKPQTALHLAAASGKTAIVSALLNAGARVDVADQDGNEPLHIAVANPTNGQIVKDLIRAGARVDAPNNVGMQPIHLAARSAGAGTVQTLLASGAKSDAVDPHGLRPLHLVAQGGAQRINASRAAHEGHNLAKLLYGMEYTMVVKVLLSNGASLDVEDKAGKRPIDYASEGGFSDMVDLLLAAGAKPPR
ncbi:MAG TPA: ankyrin repeat domain-containing protein [Nitrospira sp.]|nr:ankyrin repeat domain-containing protein [Nitrospira sp.]